jgi:GTP-binding protein
VIDTAGWKAAAESLTGRIWAQTDAAIAAADAIFFLIDVRPADTGRLPLNLVRQSGKPAILIANKAKAEPHRRTRSKPGAGEPIADLAEARLGRIS